MEVKNKRKIMDVKILRITHCFRYSSADRTHETITERLGMTTESFKNNQWQEGQTVIAHSSKQPIRKFKQLAHTRAVPEHCSDILSLASDPTQTTQT